MAFQGEASAATFTVNSTGDSADSNIGNGICDNGAEVCTLRAAIQEANALPGADTIHFSIGSGVQTIAPASALPTIFDALTIDGSTQPGFAGAPLIELAGTAAGPNATGLTITAGSSTVRALAINRFANFTSQVPYGILLRTNGGNIVESCFIGTDPMGTIALGNFVGIGIVDSSNNVVGGTTAAERNVISGNGNGVEITGDSMGNFVQGNYIGTDLTGSLDVGNDTAGVVAFAAGNTIGGTGAGARNVISANGQDGISVIDNIVVQGNYIGIDGTGTAPLANGNGGGAGVRIQGSNNLVGGAVDGARNIISANLGTGVIIRGPGNNTVQGNYIGTNATGTASLGNSSDGVLLTIRTKNNTIGGSTSGAGNVIAGNGGRGIAIIGDTFFFPDTTSDNVVQGNFVGTNAAGTAPLGNIGDGVVISDAATNNTIGGTSPAARNIISGNREGVFIVGTGFTNVRTTGNIIQGNFIGTDVTGTVAVGNLANGVLTFRSGGNTIGGPVAGARNVISGNAQAGIEIQRTSAESGFLGEPGMAVQGNFIGTNATGTAVLGNSDDGIWINGSSINTIGGTTAGARNVISGNSRHGVLIIPAGAPNWVQGNFIGTDVSGSNALGNAFDGVFISNSGSHVIGGTAPGARNVISGNGSVGVHILGIDATGVRIEGNFIGTQADGVSPRGNTSHGVFIDDSSGFHTIGGTVAGAGNTIAFNGGAGVVIRLPRANNSIQGNAIFMNAGLGIDLKIDGVTPNDVGDADFLQNFPVLTSATSGSITIEGTLNSRANATFSVEFFSNVNCDPSGHGEGERSIGSTSVTTDANGNASFAVTLTEPVLPGQFITATATGSMTSEFSACAVVAACGNGVVEGTEQCDPGPDVPGDCCTVTCTFVSAGTVCRQADGVCDAAESCTGTSSACPADGFASDGTPCDDGDLCTITDQCVSGVCTGTSVVCDDSNPCTDDSCDPVLGCQHTNTFVGTPCSDPANTECTNPDTCDGFGLCQTNDEPTTTACTDTSPDNCFDAFCDGAGTCDQNASQRVTGMPCGDPIDTACDHGDTCDGFGSCQANIEPDGTPCPDGLVCNGDETCQLGVCTSGTPIPGCCKVNAQCDNGDVCDGLETCVGNTCVPGTPLNCDDGNACTTDTCDPLTGCVNTPVNAACNDGNVCTVDTCDTALGCLNDGTGVTVACDDGNACTTTDVCQGDAAGSCAGTDTSATDCDDGIPCTTDTCNPATSCIHTPIDSACNDSNVCTVDSCDEAVGCIHDGKGVTVPCNDNNACTTGDVCQGDAAGTCAGVDTSAVDCDDAVACTLDTCNPATGCLHTPDHAVCNDGVDCTSDECNPSDPDANTETGCVNRPNLGQCHCNNPCARWGWCCNFTTMTCQPPPCVVDCNRNGIPDPDEPTTTVAFRVQCPNPPGPCANGTPWSFLIDWEGPDITGDCGPVPVGGNPPDLSAAFAQCIFDAIVAAGLQACQFTIDQPGNGAVFRVTVPGTGPLAICVGPAGGPTNCCVADNNDRCPFNPDLVLVPLSGNDCNTNGFDDAIDIAVGLSQDCNNNAVPDECQILAAPQAEPTPVAKNRFLTIVAGNAGLTTAIRVTLVSLHHPEPPYTGGPSVPFTPFEGQYRWVGPTTQYVESQSNPTPFWAATLQCEPYYTDWTSVGLLHVMGSEIVPSSAYAVEVIAEGCDTSQGTNYSALLTITTSRWGDVVDPFNPPSTTTQPDFADIGALVDKFKSVVGAPIKARAALAGSVPDLDPDIGFAHISACVDAFKGLPYPYTIAGCP